MDGLTLSDAISGKYPLFRKPEPTVDDLLAKANIGQDWWPVPIWELTDTTYRRICMCGAPSASIAAGEWTMTACADLLTGAASGKFSRHMLVEQPFAI